MKRCIAAATVAAVLFFAAAGFAQQVYVTKKGYPAAIDEKTYEQMAEYYRVKDLEAIKTLMDRGVAIIMQEGIRVYITDRAIMSPRVKLRPVGKTFEIWTIKDAVTPEE